MLAHLHQPAPLFNLTWIAQERQAGPGRAASLASHLHWALTEPLAHPALGDYICHATLPWVACDCSHPHLTPLGCLSAGPRPEQNPTKGQTSTL